MEACSLLVNLRKGMQSSSEQPLVGEERYVTTLITAAKETTSSLELGYNAVFDSLYCVCLFGADYQQGWKRHSFNHIAPMFREWCVCSSGNSYSKPGSLAEDIKPLHRW